MLKSIFNGIFFQIDKSKKPANALNLAKKGLWLEVLKVLEVDPKIEKDSFDKTVWHYAVEAQQISVIKKLSYNGIGELFCDKNGESPLHYAIKYGSSLVLQREIVSLLLQARSESARIGNMNGYTPLYLAVKSSNPDIEIIHLLGMYFKNNPSADIDRDNRDDEDNTPLHWALIGDHFSIAEHLIQLGANVDFENNAGLTPRDIASRKKYSSAILSPSFFALFGGSKMKNSSLHDGYQLLVSANK